MSRRRQAPPADFGTHWRIATALVDTTGSLSGAWKWSPTPLNVPSATVPHVGRGPERLRAEAAAAGRTIQQLTEQPKPAADAEKQRPARGPGSPMGARTPPRPGLTRIASATYRLPGRGVAGPNRRCAVGLRGEAGRNYSSALPPWRPSISRMLSMIVSIAARLRGDSPAVLRATRRTPASRIAANMASSASIRSAASSSKK